MKIRVNYGETVNLGNYESERIDISLEKDVDETKYRYELIATFNELKQICEGMVRGDYADHETR